ncbi:glycosyltransferase [Pseudoalteromonas sp. ZZD1]|uniref:glycosyltransferase n=1 Tax=Pseudoalteromonas sp. ZZD1 TaxID=3139395 RepID=UPI003BA91BFD
MPKNELYFIHLFNDYSGSPRVLRDAIDCEQENGNQKYLFTSEHKGFLTGVMCNVKTVPYKRSTNKFAVLCYFMFAQLYTFFVLSYYLIKAKVNNRQTQVVINTILPFGAGLAGKLFAGKVVWYVHEVAIDPRPLDILLKAVLRFAADEALFVTQYLQSKYAFLSCKKTVIFNGLRGDFPKNIKIDPNQKFDNKTVLFVGSLKSYKGIHSFLRLAETLPELKFVAALNCTSDELTLLKVIPKNLEIHIRPSNLEKLYMDAMLLVNLSIPTQWVETFGLTIIEGFSFGCPAIIPPVGGPTEFTDESNAVQIDSRSFEQLVTCVENISTDYNIWFNMFKSANSVAQGFTTEQFQRRVSPYFSIEKLRTSS